MTTNQRPAPVMPGEQVLPPEQVLPSGQVLPPEQVLPSGVNVASVWKSILESPKFNKLDYDKQIEYSNNFYRNVLVHDKKFRSLESDEMREKYYDSFIKTVKPKSNIWEEVKHGFSIGSAGYGTKPDWNRPEAPTAGGRFAGSATTLLSDFPAMAAGAIVGSPIPIVGSAAGAIGAAEAIRASRYSADTGMPPEEAAKHIAKRGGLGMASGAALATGGGLLGGLAKRLGGKAATQAIAKISGELAGLQSVSFLETGRTWSGEELATNVMLIGGLRAARKPIDLLKHIENKNFSKASESRIDRAFEQAKGGNKAALERLGVVLGQEGVEWSPEKIQQVATSYVGLNEALKNDAKLHSNFLKEAESQIIKKAYTSKQFLEYADGFPKGADPKVILEKFAKGEPSPAEIERTQKPILEEQARIEGSRALEQQKAKDLETKEDVLQEARDTAKPEAKLDGMDEVKPEANTPEAKPDVFMRMPLDELRKQADLGVRMAQEELNTRAIAEAKPMAERPPEAKAEAKPETKPESATRDDIEKKYPIAGDSVDGRMIGKGKVKNLSSIDSSLDNPIVLPKIREISVSLFKDSGKPTFYSQGEKARTEKLAQDIKKSGTIDPLIVIDDGMGSPYILEGGHRFDALKLNGAKSFPAKVVIDGDAYLNLKPAAEPVKVAKPIAGAKPPEAKAEAEKAEVRATPKEQKQFLLDAVDEAIKKKERGKTVTIKVPDDGTFRIPNTKANLEAFRKNAAKIPTGTPGPGRAPKPSSNPPTKRYEFGDVEYYRDYRPRKQGLIEGDANYYSEGFFTNGKYTIKAKRPSGIKLEESELEVGKFFPKDATIEARIVGEFAEGKGNRVHVKGKDGRDIILNPTYVDSILTQYPEAKPFLSKSAKEMVVFKVGKEQVGIVMSIREGVPTDLAREAGGKPVPPDVLADYPDFKGAKSEETAKTLKGKPIQPKGVTLSFMGVGEAQKGMESISKATSAIIESHKTIPEVARGVESAKEAMIEHDRNIRRAESTSRLFEKTVNDIVPKSDRQMLMVHAYEHKMQGKYWHQLTEIEKGVVRWAAQEKAKLNKYIKDNKVLETMKESENVNHIYHHWIDKATGEPYQPMYGKFSKGLPQSKQRVIPTYEIGIAKGMSPATTNLGKLIGLEWEAASRANNARQLFKTLHGIKGDPSTSIVLRSGMPPQPIRMVESWSKLEQQNLTDGYIRYDSPFLDKAVTFTSSDGRIVTMKGAVGIHENLYPFVRAYLENPNYGKLSELNFASKSLKLGMSLFHPVSLGMQELANLRTPFVHIPKGLRLAKELGPEVRLLHQEGLELFKGYEDFGGRNKFFDNGSFLGKAGNAVTWPIAKMRDFIFDYVQPGMKVSFAHMQLTKMLPRYLEGTGFTAEQVMRLYDEGKPIPREALRCAREVVQKADGHFSGEHYKRALLETNRFMVKLYFTPEARKVWQALLLSPTWQREHLLVAKNVAKSFIPNKMIKRLGMSEMGPIKSQYQRYLLGAIMMVGAVDLFNYMNTEIMDGKGKHIFQNPPGKGFAIRAPWNEPRYVKISKSGKRTVVPSAPAYIRPLKSVFEVAEGIHDPFAKLAYKISPIMTAIGKQFFGRKKYSGWASIPERIKDFILDSSTPIIVGQAEKTIQGKQSVQATAFPFFGMPVSRVNKK